MENMYCLAGALLLWFVSTAYAILRAFAFRRFARKLSERYAALQPDDSLGARVLTDLRWRVWGRSNLPDTERAILANEEGLGDSRQVIRKFTLKSFGFLLAFLAWLALADRVCGQAIV